MEHYRHLMSSDMVKKNTRYYTLRSLRGDNTRMCFADGQVTQLDVTDSESKASTCGREMEALKSRYSFVSGPFAGRVRYRDASGTRVRGPAPVSDVKVINPSSTLLALCTQ